MEKEIIIKHSEMILRSLVKRMEKLNREIEKNDLEITSAPLSEVGSMKYWKRQQKSDVLYTEKIDLGKEIYDVYIIADVENKLHQDRFSFIKESKIVSEGLGI